MKNVANFESSTNSKQAGNLVFTTIAAAQKITGLSYLGTVNISHKLLQNQIVSNVLTYCIYIAAGNQSGYEVCSHKTKECEKFCLLNSGQAGMERKSGGCRIANARIKKAKLFFEENLFFMAWMKAEIAMHAKAAAKKNMFFACRLNGTSDIDYSKVNIDGKNIFEVFNNIQFYDYTKNPHKFENKPANYHLTFSYTGRNTSAAETVLQAGGNVAVVFSTKKNKPLPANFMNYPVLDGDITDYRPSDANGHIVGLRFKNLIDSELNKAALNSCFVVKAELL